MKKTFEIIKTVLLVTVCGPVVLASSYVWYYLIFLAFEAMSKDGAFHYVSSLRIIYGILWLAAGVLIYGSKLPDWIKACVLTGSVGTFLIAAGVTLYEMPVLAGVLIAIVIAVSAFLLFKTKKKWYHYYALALSLLAGILYL